MLKYLKIIIIGCLIFGCHSVKPIKNYTSETLIIQKIADHAYQHISFLETESFGKVACNGMIVFDKNEVIIFNTPTDNVTSLELINWVEKELNCKIKAIIPTHFHADCLGGLAAFHERKIPSFAHQATIKIAESKHLAVPQSGFDQVLKLKVGNKQVLAEFLGEGHTKDNVIGYFPAEKIMFGGCLIKELGAGKGNLADANIQDWPLTVAKVKEKYPDTKITIPGHGKIGGPELFDYTIKLFEQK